MGEMEDKGGEREKGEKVIYTIYMYVCTMNEVSEGEKRREGGRRRE